MPRTLILEPTRELAAQVHENFEKYGKNHRLNVALLIGGVSFDDQNKILDRGADVLIATPGRMLDQFERGRILLSGVEILVIDEADRMLDMGFIPDIERICGLLPARRQTLFFSATMAPEIEKLTRRFLKDPIRIDLFTPHPVAIDDQVRRGQRAVAHATVVGEAHRVGLHVVAAVDVRVPAVVEHRRTPAFLGDNEHIGIYAYRREALARWVALPEHHLERIERLEQLRPLAAGMHMGVAATADVAPPGVDTEEDLAHANARWDDFIARRS